MESFLIKLYVTVETKEDADEIASDIEEILDDNGITNSFIVEE